MKNLLLSFGLAILVLLGDPASGGEEKGEEGGSRAGPNFAVTAFEPKEGFKLSEKALDTLKIRFKTLNAQGPWKVSKDSIVTLKQSTGVYRRYKGWITFVLVKLNQKLGDSVLISSEDLQPEDEIAVSGVSFLRMTEADLNSDTSDACAH